MANVRLLILATPSILSQQLEAEAQAHQIQTQTYSTDEWPWHDPKAMSQRLLQSGATLLVFTGLIEPGQRDWPGMRELASCCHNAGVALLLCSTCEVFSGHQGGLHTEKDPCDAQSPFGLQAIAIEEQVRAASPRHLILRTGWLFSGQDQDLLTYYLDAARKHTQLRVNSSFKIAPLAIGDFTQVLMAVINQVSLTETLWGTYHYASTESIDLYHFVDAVLAEVHKQDTLAAQEILAEENAPIPNELHVKGGLLSGKKIMYNFGIKPKAWRPALARTLRKLFEAKALTATEGY